MKTNSKSTSSQVKRILIGTALILSVPLVTMQFSSGVNWSLGDFIIIAALLIGGGLSFVLIAARINPKYRTILALAVAVTVLLAWAELAVGIFGTPFAGS